MVPKQLQSGPLKSFTCAHPPYPDCKKVWNKDDIPEDIVVVVAISQLVHLMSQCTDTLDPTPFVEAHEQYRAVISMGTLLQTKSLGSHNVFLKLGPPHTTTPHPHTHTQITRQVKMGILNNTSCNNKTDSEERWVPRRRRSYAARRSDSLI